MGVIALGWVSIIFQVPQLRVRGLQVHGWRGYGVAAHGGSAKVEVSQ